MSFLRGVIADIYGKDELLQWGASLEMAAGNSRVTAWRWDFRTRELEYGPHFRETFGFGPAEPVDYDTWFRHLDPRAREKEKRALLVFLNGRARRERVELPYVTAGGETHWVEMRRRVERTSQGKPLRLTAICIDISDAKRMELALREREETFRALFEQTAVGIARLDLDGKYQQVNDRFCEITGYSRGELLKMCIFDSRHPGGHERDSALLKRLASGDVSYVTTEERYLRKNGSAAWILRTLSLGRNAMHAAQFLISVIEDITRRKQIEKELQEHREFSRRARSAAGIGIWEWDPATGQQKWSPETYRLFGIPEGHKAPTMQSTLNLIHPDDRQMISEILRHIESGQQENGEAEYRVLPASGDVRWITSKAQVHRAKRGSAIRVVGASYDVTARRQAEETVRRTEKLSVAETMATSMAHEINNPLFAVSNLLYLIGNCSSLEDAHRYSVIAERELQRVTQLTTHALRFQQQASRPTPTRVSEIVDTVTILHEQRLHPTNVEITRDFRDRHLLTGWEHDLRQLFGNLVSNALEAVLNGGRVVLRVFERTNYRTGEAGVCVLIADTGRGMNAEVQRRLFEPFFTTKDKTGIGLGLWVSSEIVKKHNGSIRFRSSQAKQHHGTVAAVFLPFRSSATSRLAAA